MQIHRILGEKVRLYRRVENGSWHASTYISGKERRTSTKKKSLAEAKDVAEDWYIDLRGKARHGELSSGKTFRQAAELFTSEYEALTAGRRSPKWVEGHRHRPCGHRDHRSHRTI